MKLLKLICTAKVQEEADNTSQAQNHNLQAHSGVPLVRLPLCEAWLVIKAWLSIGHALKQESGFKSSTPASFRECCAAWQWDTAWAL